MNLRGRTYDQHYREQVESRTGTPLLLRLIVPGDKEKLIEGFEALSSQSRYTRFFASKNGLTERELKYFTETDGFEYFRADRSIGHCFGYDLHDGYGPRGLYIPMRHRTGVFP